LHQYFKEYGSTGAIDEIFFLTKSISVFSALIFSIILFKILNYYSIPALA